MTPDEQRAEEIVRKINDQRNRIAGGYDIPRDEPGPVALITAALRDERRRTLEEAANYCYRADKSMHPSDIARELLRLAGICPYCNAYAAMWLSECTDPIHTQAIREQARRAE